MQIRDHFPHRHVEEGSQTEVYIACDTRQNVAEALVLSMSLLRGKELKQSVEANSVLDGSYR